MPDRPWTVGRVLRGLVRHGPAALTDVGVTAAAYLVAVGVRTGGQFDTPVPGIAVPVMALEAGILAVAANIFFRTYWRAWTVAALEDLVALAAANGVVAGLLGLVQWLTDFHPIPYTAIVAGAGLSFIAQGAVKLRPRWSQILRTRVSPGTKGEPIIVVGAGRTGQLLARDLSDGSRGYQIACFVDDDPMSWGTYVRGVRVAGRIAELPRLVSRHRPKMVVIALARPSGALVRQVVDICDGLDVQVRAVSGFSLSPDARAPLREIGIEELLEREPVVLDTPETRAYLSGKTVLVTGAAGSI